ncbi:MAG: response regulator transcription factor [Oceanivirga sp.]|nr:response regulator transcription factor [Oceanivirga sp.]
MKVNLSINSSVKDTVINIETNEITDEIMQLINMLENFEKLDKIIAVKNDRKYLLSIKEVVRFYAQDKKVYLTHNNEDYIVKYYLYELEEKLDKNMFIRVSNSEIMNINYIESLDTSFSGSIKVKTKTGIITYVSRGYLKEFKKILNL